MVGATRDRTANHFFQSLKSLSYRRRCLNPNRIEQNINSKTVPVSSFVNPAKNQLTFLRHNWLLISVNAARIFPRWQKSICIFAQLSGMISKL